MVSLAAAAVMLLALALPAAAQPPAAAQYVGQTVTSVTLAIEGRSVAEPSLARALVVQAGRPLTMSDVRETITHLYTLGRFEDIRVEAGPAPGGVALRIVLEPIHVVTKVEFRGRTALPESLLRDRMTERFGATPPLGKAGEVATVLQQLYQERGYLSAVVRPIEPIIEHDPDRATMVLSVEAGPRTTIGRSTIAGQPLEPVSRVIQRLHVGVGDPYEPADLRTRLADYVDWMRKRGYYQAVARDLAPRFNADKTQVELTVEVDPGPSVTVRFTGDPIPKDKLDELVPIEREGSVDEDILEDSARRIVEYLQQQGYWKAEVRPPERTEQDGRLTLVFHVARGRLYRVAPGGVEIDGNQSIPITELRPLIRISEGEPFVASKLGAAESAMTQAYRSRGFATAEITSAVNEVAPGVVKPVIVVKEGPKVTIGTVAIAGNAAVPTFELNRAMTLKPGDPYYGPRIAADRDAIQTVYQNRGFLAASVTVAPVTPTPAPEGARADIRFDVAEGPQTVVEHIFVTGNVKTDPAVVLGELDIHENAPLGMADLTESRRKLSSLGLFRRIQITTVPQSDPSKTDVIVHVEEASQTTIGYGGGLQIDRILRSTGSGGSQERYEFAPRGFFEIGRRNLGGRNRSLNLYTRISLRPNDAKANGNPFGFSEYRVVATYSEPRAFHNFGDATGTAAVEQGVRTGFNFSRKGLNAELSRRVTPRIRASGRYSFNTTHIFDEQLAEEERLTVDRVFSQVRLSSFSAALSRDSRDDLLEPQRGTFVSADTTLAARAIGSEVGFTKTFLQGFFYRNLGRPNLVFAGGARLGIARAFVRQAQGEEVRDLPASERFFAGGDTTIRGFSLDSVGAPGTITAQGFPKGGDAEIVLNAELRTPIAGPIGAAFFLDGGNVFARAADLDLGQLRRSAGFGLRYRSPIGPIRIDIGFKLGRQIVGGRLEPRYALHFSIGQAF